MYEHTQDLIGLCNTVSYAVENDDSNVHGGAQERSVTPPTWKLHIYTKNFRPRQKLKTNGKKDNIRTVILI